MAGISGSTDLDCRNDKNENDYIDGEAQKLLPCIVFLNVMMYSFVM